MSGSTSIKMAEDIKNGVRTFFKDQIKSFGSGNKRYLPGSQGDSNHPNRNRLQPKARQIISDQRNSRTDAGDKDNWMIAGNCAEMADLAAQKAKIPGFDYRYKVGISAPGDHAFLLVTTAWQKKDNFQNLKIFSGGMDEGSIVIDPWLNTVCMVRQYPFYAEAKLLKWRLNNKQIWVRGNWVDADARYLRNFVYMGPIKLSLYW